ncbi:MAG: hypothetical protein IID16_09930 [Candidatus Marinimicrobia bacterium]|nr:hypothetical protein [Candidatus Neomarinimicrobiota bacterium]
MKNTGKAFVVLLFFSLSVVSAQKRQLTNLTSDTLFIELPGHSSLSDLTGIGVVDNRYTKGQVIGVYQITRWLYIPVDRYLVLPDSLATVFSTFLSGDAPSGSSQIVIDHLTIWDNKKSMFGKGRTLTAYTRFVIDQKKQLSCLSAPSGDGQATRQALNSLIQVT